VTERRPGLARDTALSTVGILLSGGAQFLVSLLVGRIGGPHALGVMRGSLSLAATASLLWPSVAGQSASLFVARSLGAGEPGRAAAYERYLTRTTAAITVALAVVAAVVARLVLGLSVVDSAWVAALVVAFSAYQLARGIRFGRGEVARATWWEAAAAAVMVGLIAAVLVVQLPGLYLAPLVTGYGLYAAGVWLRPAREPGRLGAGERAELGTFVVWGVAGTLASSGLMQLSMVIAAALEAGRAAGLYAAAISLATPMSMVARALSMALFPEMARQHGRGDETVTRAITDRVTRGLVLVMVPAFGSVALLAEPLMVLVFGTEYRDAVPALRVLLLAVLLTTIPVAAVNSINVRGPRGVRASALMSWGGLVVGMGTIGALVGSRGILGVAVGYLAGSAVTAGLPFAYVWRRDGHRWCPLTLALVAAVLSVAATLAAGARLTEWTWSLGATAVFLITWGLFARLFSQRRRSRASRRDAHGGSVTEL